VPLLLDRAPHEQRVAVLLGKVDLGPSDERSTRMALGAQESDGVEVCDA
jgi:hypothetical protein